MIARPSTAHVVGVLALSLAASSAAAQSILSQFGEVVHACGDPIPPAASGVTPAPAGTTISTTSSNFDSPVMDQNGTILYRALMAGSGVTGADHRALFLGRASGDLQMVMRAGDQAPGLAPGILMRNNNATNGSAGFAGGGGNARISPYGEYVLVPTKLYDPVTPANTPFNADSALYWGSFAGITPIVVEGQMVPANLSANGELWGECGAFNGYTYFGINSTGTALFTFPMTGGTPAVTSFNDAVMVVGTPGNLTLVEREGDALPGGEVVAFSSGTLSGVNQLNEAGEVLYDLKFSTTAPSTATTANDRALAFWSPISGRQIIMREGDDAPDIADPNVLLATSGNGWTVEMGHVSFTKSGDTFVSAFLWDFIGGSVTTLNDSALYYGGKNGWTMVAREGDAVPGLGGPAWRAFGAASLTCNDAGEVAFLSTLIGASVTTANDSGLWVGLPGNLTMIAREGDPVPCLPGHIWSNMNAGTNNPLLNGDGNVFFQATVRNTTTLATSVHLFGWTPEHGHRLLLQLGDSFTTSLGTGTWTNFAHTAGANSGDGCQMMFNNQGDFVTRLIASSPSPWVGLIMRGHLGSMVAEPSAVPVAGGVAQEFHLDCGPSYGNQFYFILATGLGTRPGFPHPLNFGITVPMNYDPVWTAVSQAWVNTPLWTNTLGVTDANGVPLGNPPISFNMPAGFPGFLGTTVHHSALLFDGSLMGTYATEPSALKFY